MLHLHCLPHRLTPTPIMAQNKGVDSVLCLSVNDCFVMDAWAASVNLPEDSLISCIADGLGKLTRCLSLDCWVPDSAMGTRCRRCALIVDDGLITHAFVEPDNHHVSVSSADWVLKHL